MKYLALLLLEQRTKTLLIHLFLATPLPKLNMATTPPKVELLGLALKLRDKIYRNLLSILRSQLLKLPFGRCDTGYKSPNLP